MKRLTGNSHEEILRQMGDVKGIAEACGFRGINARQNVYQWIYRDRIPAIHWDTVIDVAASRGLRLSRKRLHETYK